MNESNLLTFRLQPTICPTLHKKKGKRTSYKIRDGKQQPKGQKSKQAMPSTNFPFIPRHRLARLQTPSSRPLAQVKEKPPHEPLQANPKTEVIRRVVICVRHRCLQTTLPSQIHKKYSLLPPLPVGIILWSSGTAWNMVKLGDKSFSSFIILATFPQR